MDQSLLAIIIAVPTVAVVLLVSAKALLPSVELTPASALGRIAAKDALFDWLLHFGLGAMILAIGTVAGISSVARPTALIGAIAGVAAAGIAFAVSRPPLRLDARNPEIDAAAFCLSVVIHAGVGMGLALMLIGYSST